MPDDKDNLRRLPSPSERGRPKKRRGGGTADVVSLPPRPVACPPAGKVARAVAKRARRNTGLPLTILDAVLPAWMTSDDETVMRASESGRALLACTRSVLAERAAIAELAIAMAQHLDGEDILKPCPSCKDVAIRCTARSALLALVDAVNARTCMGEHTWTGPGGRCAFCDCAP